jgi:D-alanyl-lipoteichoic acid acyltransferase DltB (MBOAT superfamily)
LSTWFCDYVYIPLGGGRGTLSPFASTPQDREIALYLFVTAATWAVPLVLMT